MSVEVSYTGDKLQELYPHRVDGLGGATYKTTRGDSPLLPDPVEVKVSPEKIPTIEEIMGEASVVRAGVELQDVDA